MLVTGSPFPPYTPTHVDENAKPVYGDLDTASEEVNSYCLWYDVNTVQHRDDDMPAEVSYDGGAEFYIHGVLHRVNGYAKIYGDDLMKKWNSFWLYGIDLRKDAFLKVHRWAIKYNIPLWVAVIAELHQVDLDKNSEETVESEWFLNNAPLEWILRFWGVDAKDWNHGKFSEKRSTYTELISGVGRVITHEKDGADCC